MWDQTAMTAGSQLIVALVVGKRTHEQTKALVHAAQQRLRPRHLPAIFAEAYAGDASAILDAFGQRSPVPSASQGGRPARPQLRWPQGGAYGQVNKPYKGRGIERVAVRVIPGKARLNPVLSLLGDKVMTTSVVERHKGTSRLRKQRKVRKTLAFAKATR